MSAIVAEGLGKRYGRRWALRDCTLEIPDGSVVGLVGANGAGKSTLLHLTVGLLEPTEGSLAVLGGRPGADAAQLAKVGFVAQDAPVYGWLSVADHLRLGAHMNPGWDTAMAGERISRLGLDLAQRAGKLSGGQRSQLALTLAIGKRPELLVLDEPVASLDPLARRTFLADVMELMADRQPTIILSSHLLSDIERVCDHLIVMAEGRVQLAGSVDELLDGHKLLTGPRRDLRSMPTRPGRGPSEPHGPPDHGARPHGRADPRPGLDRRRRRARGPRPGLHGEHRPHSPTGAARGGAVMTWLAWRQARAQALVAVGATAIVAVVLVATRAHIASTPEEDLSTFYSSLQLLGTVLIGVPAAIGAFWGAPLLARELELGTHRLAWTQGVTRGRWLATKLVVLAAATIVVTAAFAALFTWWSLPLDAHGNRIGTANFGQRGIAPIAYALFALALGALRRRDHPPHVAGHGRDPRRVLRRPVHVPVGGAAATRRHRHPDPPAHHVRPARRAGRHRRRLGDVELDRRRSRPRAPQRRS